MTTRNFKAKRALESMADRYEQSASNNGNGDYRDPELDRANALELERILRQGFWPIRSRVGNKAAAFAVRIALNADHSVEFQRTCMGWMKTYQAFEVDPEDVARLRERISLNVQRFVKELV